MIVSNHKISPNRNNVLTRTEKNLKATGLKRELYYCDKILIFVFVCLFIHIFNFLVRMNKCAFSEMIIFSFVIMIKYFASK